MESSIARYGRSYHLCSGSFRVRIEIKWKFALNSMYPDKFSKTVGDIISLHLMAILMLISIKN